MLDISIKRFSFMSLKAKDKKILDILLLVSFLKFEGSWLSIDSSKFLQLFSGELIIVGAIVQLALP